MKKKIWFCHKIAHILFIKFQKTQWKFQTPTKNYNTLSITLQLLQEGETLVSISMKQKPMFIECVEFIPLLLMASFSRPGRRFIYTFAFASNQFFLKSAKAFFLILSLLSFNATFSVWKNICVSVCVCIVYIWSIHQQFHSIVNKSKRKKFCAMSLCHHTHSEKWNRIYSVRHK